MLPWNLLFYLGIILFLGYILGKITHYYKLTAIVGYIIAGIILGLTMNHVMDDALSDYTMNIIVDLTLGLVGFIIGIGFTRGFIRSFGKMAFGIAILQSTVTFFIVFAGVYFFSFDLKLSLILGVIGLATAPAGTVAAIHLCGGRGKLSRMTIAIVGVDDGIGIIYFVFVLIIVKFLIGAKLTTSDFITIPMIELGGAVILGAVFGGGLAIIGKLVKHRDEVFILTICFLFICVGICEIVKASSILACMILGVVFINMAPRIGRTAYTNIETIIPPIFVLFFAVAGLELSLRFDSIIKFGIVSTIGIIIIYCLVRIGGKIIGAYVAGRSMKAPKKIQKYLGYALLSQAGVALGLAILVNNELSQHSGTVYLGALVITIITLTTVFFEILGPIGVKYALKKAGETHEGPFDAKK